MSRPNPTIIGAFVLGAIALIVAAVLVFGGGALEKRIPFVSFFQGSVAGLRVGAAVTFRGVHVGEVKSIGIRLNPDTYGSIVQVNMELLPETVALYGGHLPKEQKMVATLVERGLTTKLVPQSYVTGLLNVDLDFRPGIEGKSSGEALAVPEVPSVPTDIEAIARKLETVDIAATLQTVERTLASLDRILTSPDLTQTIKELPALTSELRHTVKTIDREVAAFSSDGRKAINRSADTLEKTLASVQSLAATLEHEMTSTASATRATLDRASTALDGTNNLLDPRGRTVLQVQRAIDDLAASAARLRSFAERVDRDPSTLIRGR